MTQDIQGSMADAFKYLNDAEKQATLEKMLDAFEAKLDSILKDAENINKPDEAEHQNGYEDDVEHTDENENENENEGDNEEEEEEEGRKKVMMTKKKKTPKIRVMVRKTLIEIKILKRTTAMQTQLKL